MTEDRRRRQYVPLYVHFAAGHTGQEILKRFGVAGLGTWACLLAAAKRSSVQGSFEWYSEADAWRQLALHVPHDIDFTFEEFVKALGRLHLVRTTKRGEVKTTEISAWNEWNTVLKRQQGADRKRAARSANEVKTRSKRGQNEQKTRLGRGCDDAENTSKSPQNMGDKARTMRRTEGEGEGETPLPPRRRRTRAQPEHPLAITDDRNRCPDCGARQRTASELADHLKYVHGHQPAHPKAAA